MAENSLAFSQDMLIRADPVTLYNLCFCLPQMHPCNPDLGKTWDSMLWRCHIFVMACSGALNTSVLLCKKTKKVLWWCGSIVSQHRYLLWLSMDHPHCETVYLLLRCSDLWGNLSCQIFDELKLKFRQNFNQLCQLCTTSIMKSYLPN